MREKNCGSLRRMRSDHLRLFSKRWSRGMGRDSTARPADAPFQQPPWMVAETALPRPPLGSCGLYSTVRVAKLSENWSTGTLELDPPVWYDVTMTFFSSYLRYSCCPS